MKAEELGHYWKTSKKSSDAWMEATVNLIKKHGGTPLQSFSGIDMVSNRSAIMIAFQMDGETFKITWPALQSKTGNKRAALVQAATLVHHAVKTRLLEARVIGSRAAFFGFLMLDDGRNMSELGNSEITNLIPPLLLSNVDVEIIVEVEDD